MGDIVPGSAFRLTPRPAEVRRDPIVDRHTIFAPQRAARPFLPPGAGSPCPFCEGREQETCPEVDSIRAAGTAPDQPGWRVRAVPNLYPSVQLDSPARGLHEVIIDCPQHETSVANLGADHFVDWLTLWQRRIRDHARVPGLAYTLIFKNQGAAAGASLEHSHAQVISLERVPQSIREELDAGRGYHDRHGRCIFCDYLGEELRDGRRVVEADEATVTVAARAGRFPFETWLLPRGHQSHFEEAGARQLAASAHALWRCLRRLQRGLCDPPYNLVLHNGPVGSGGLGSYHWHLEVLPRLSQPAGFEWGTNWSVNAVPPEQAADYLRQQGTA